VNNARFLLAWCGLCLGLLCGCAPGPVTEARPEGAGVFVEGVVIRNELAYPVTDVMIEVPATRRFAGCGNILPRSQCSNAFQQLDYRQNDLVVSWKEHGESHNTDPFVVALPGGVQPGDTLVLEVIVFAPGQAGARLVPLAQAGVRTP